MRLIRYLGAWWWGSLTTVGFVVVPLLFVHLETPAMAGQMAAKLFGAQTWISVVCGVLCLLVERRQHLDQPYSPSLPVLAALLAALLLELAVKPHIVAGAAFCGLPPKKKPPKWWLILRLNPSFFSSPIFVSVWRA